MPVNVGGNIISSSSLTSDGVFKNVIVTEGLISHLDAGNINSYPGSGTAWNDLSGNGNGATLINATYTSENGGGIQFGYNAYATHNITSAPYQGNFTMNIIFKHTKGYNFGDWDWLYTMNAYGNGMTVTTLQDKIRFNYGQWFTDGFDWTKYPVMTVGNYYMMTVGRSGNTTFGYLNGASYLGWNSTSATPTLTNFRIGCPPNSNVAQEYWNGIINTLQVYNRALSYVEVIQNYYANKVRFGI